MEIDHTEIDQDAPAELVEPAGEETPPEEDTALAVAAGGRLEIRADRDELADGFSRSGRGVGSRTSMPILQGVLCEADGDRLRITGSSLDVTVRTTVEVSVLSEGRCVVPSKLITDVLRKMPEGAITISETDGAVEISGQGSGEDGPRFSVRVMSVDDFPNLEDPNLEDAVTVSGKKLAAAIAQVTVAASSDEARPILTGVQIESEDGGMRLVATDSYRLAVRDLPEVSLSGSGLVPARGLSELERTVGADEVSVSIDERSAVFASERGSLSLRLIDGTFPNYRQLLPDSHPNRLTFHKDQMLEAIGRAALVAEDHIPIKLKLDAKGASLSVNRQDVGSESELIPGTFDGEEEEIDVAFNHGYVRDGVAAVETDEVTLEVVDGLKPGLIKGREQDDFQYLLMPVRV